MKKLFSFIAAVGLALSSFAQRVWSVDPSKALSTSADELDGVTCIVTSADNQKVWSTNNPDKSSWDVLGIDLTKWRTLSNHGYVKFVKPTGDYSASGATGAVYYIYFYDDLGGKFSAWGGSKDSPLNQTGGTALFCGINENKISEFGQDRKFGALWTVTNDENGYTIQNVATSQYATPASNDVLTAKTYVQLYSEMSTHVNRDTEAEAEGDYTNFIMNPNVDGSLGWTTVKASGCNGPLKDNTSFECWKEDPTGEDFNYYQKFSDLPSGKYMLSADMYNTQVAAPNGNAGAYISNGSKESFVGVDIDGDVYQNYSTSPINVNEGDVITIGVKNIGAMSARWFRADNFKLTRTGDADVLGSEDNPFIITAGKPVQGPGAAGDYPFTYTYYQYTATQAGAVSLNTSELGYVMGNIIVGGTESSYGSSVIVAEGDVVTVKLTSQTGATDKTFTLNIRDFAEGETKETAKALAVGENNDIAAMASGDLPLYYSVSIPAKKKLFVKFDGNPGSTLVVGEEEYPAPYGVYTLSYINSSEEAVNVYVKVTSNYQACKATVAFSDPITKMGAPVFNVTEGAELETAPESITIKFDNTDAQAADAVKADVSVYLTDKDGNTVGSALNSPTVYTRTVADGITISGIEYEAGESYKVVINTVGIREVGEDYMGKIYDYTFPNATETTENTTSTVKFSIKAEGNILVNGDFSGVGDLASGATDRYATGEPWVSNVAFANMGIRVQASSAATEGGNVIVWRGSGNSNYISQPVTVKAGAIYKVTIKQVAVDNAYANFNVGFGTAAGKYDVASNIVRLGQNNGGIKTVNVAIPESLESTDVYFTFANTSNNTASAGSDPVSQIDYFKVEKLTKAEALAYVKQTTIASLPAVGDGIFAISQTEHDNAKAYINSCPNMDALNGYIQYSMPKPEAFSGQWFIENVTATGMSLGYEGTQPKLVASLTPITFEKADGGFYIKAGDKYINMRGDNNWSMSADAEAKTAWNATLTDGKYTIRGPKGLIGANGTTAGESLYGDKAAGNNGTWTITKFENTFTVNGGAYWATPDNSESARFTTFYSSKYAYTLPTGVTAYTATFSDETIILSPCEAIPAGQAVVIKSNEYSYTLTVDLDNTDAPAVNNILEGSDVEVAKSSVRGTIYTLDSQYGSDGYVLGFYQYTGDNLRANKAYIAISAGEEAQLRIVFADDATAINAVAAESTKTGKYMENGRVVIVKNGKKYNTAGQIVK